MSSKAVTGDVVDVPYRVVVAVLGAIAAVIEEPHCYAGADEVRGLVRVHRSLSRVLGDAPDYAWRDGQVLSARDRSQVIKDLRGQASVHVRLVPVPKRLNALPVADGATS